MECLTASTLQCFNPWAFGESVPVLARQYQRHGLHFNKARLQVQNQLPGWLTQELYSTGLVIIGELVIAGS
jgi:hypothetical protein